MNRKELIYQIHDKQSFLCVGLDTDINKIPKHLLDLEDPVFEFNKQIIDATKDLCVAYKPNIAFYEALGPKGWVSLQKTIEYIPSNCFTIADAKRGDIGNTANMYARTFFETYSFDSVTINPYMGLDTIQPYLQYKNAWAIILALTSNPGSADFERLTLSSKSTVFESVLHKTQSIGTIENLMYVVGATQANELEAIRKIIPKHFLLVPGVGAQGGDLTAVFKNGAVKNDIALLVNSSRSIIYASDDKNFALSARNKAQELQIQMSNLLNM